MRNLLNLTIILLVLWTSFICFGGGVETIDTEESTDKDSDVTELYEKGRKAAKDKKFQDALRLFQEAQQKDPENPDVLNMLAYTQRKLGNLDDAFTNYRKALTLRPRFPEAREYLAEAHLQAIMLEIETLKSYGEDGAEQLGDLIQALKRTAANVESPSSSGSENDW